jgi:hypothetical protein
MPVIPRSRMYAPAYKLLYRHAFLLIRTGQIGPIRHTGIDTYRYVDCAPVFGRQRYLPRSTTHGTANTPD